MAFAGNLAYHAMLTVVPLLVLLLSLLGAFNAEQLLDSALEAVGDTLPEAAIELLDEQLGQIAETQSPGLFGFGAILAALVSLWAVSGAVRSLIEALNVIHGTSDSRSLVRRFALSLGGAVALAVLLVVALAVVVIDADAVRRIADNIGLGTLAAELWVWSRWPLVLVLMTTALAYAYRVLPDTDRSVPALSAGPLVAAVGWLVFSLGFSLYVNNFGSYDATYGAAAGIVVLTLYLYWASLIVLVGAQVDYLRTDARR